MNQFRRPLSSAERSKARKPIPTTSMRNSLASGVALACFHYMQPAREYSIRKCHSILRADDL